MELSKEQLDKLSQIFSPHILGARDIMIRNDEQFVHYTSADAAYSILKNKAFWMRNVAYMNDYSEMHYGMGVLKTLFNNPRGVGAKFFSLLSDLDANIARRVDGFYTQSLDAMVHDTYITSLSTHPVSENQIGRLSMWRGYGTQVGVALVLNRDVLFSETNTLKVYGSPAIYSPAELQKTILTINNNMEQEQEFLKSLPRDLIVNVVTTFLQFCVYCLKHPGFAEEREWRVIYRPTLEKSEKLIKDVACVNGIPQDIHKVPLEPFPDEPDFIGTHPQVLIKQVIIGPSKHPEAIRRQFIRCLEDLQVEKPYEKVVVSDIPLRT